MAYGTLIETHTHPREYVARSSTEAKRFRNREGFFRRMRKVLGGLTEDFRLYHDLVAARTTTWIARSRRRSRSSRGMWVGSISLARSFPNLPLASLVSAMGASSTPA